MIINSLKSTAAEVARSLSTVELVAGTAFISTPLLYPGGTSVVIRIDQHGERFIVTDAGLGSREAEMMGGDRQYKKMGQSIAERFGVTFDQESFFAAEAAREDLVPFVTAIANASRSAVELTAYKVAEKVARDTKEIMKAKLVKAFDPTLVTTDYEVRGASNDFWSFDAAVKSTHGLALFQMVTPAPMSVHSAVVRFVDVADLAGPDAPNLIAVLENPAKTRHLRLVERSAKTIELGADITEWQQAAA